MIEGWWQMGTAREEQGNPDLPLVNGDLKLIFYVPDISTEN